MDKLVKARLDWLTARAAEIADALGRAIPLVRRVNAGLGLSGGGALDADISLALAASGVTPGSYTLLSGTVDAYGRLIAAANGSGGGTVDELIWSPVDRVAQTGITPSWSSGDITYGTAWLPMRRSVVTGIRFWWAHTVAELVTVRLWLPDGSVGASGTVMTTTTPGIYTATFASPYTIALANVGKLHYTTTYSGTGYTFANGESSTTRPPDNFLAGPYWMWVTSNNKSGYYATGHDIPFASDAQDAYIEPVIQP